MAAKALVTGGAGFIGSYLSELLLDEGVEVWVLDDLSTGSLENVAHLRDRPGFHLVVDSVLHSTAVNELVYRCDVVYHLAAAVGVRLIVEQPVRTLVTNLRGTEIVLEHAHTFGKRVLVASTSEVYGDHREERPLAEDDRRIYGPTTQRRWAYADSKAMDEFLALAHHRSGPRRRRRAPLQHGRSAAERPSTGWSSPGSCVRRSRDEPLEIHGDGTQTRCFCHVQDTIRALHGLMERGVSGEIYNVGSANRIGILELAQARRRADRLALGDPVRAVRRGLRQGIEDMLHRIPSIDKISDAVGWTPERSLDDILEDVVRPRAGGARRGRPAQLRSKTCARGGAETDTGTSYARNVIVCTDVAAAPATTVGVELRMRRILPSAPTHTSCVVRPRRVPVAFSIARICFAYDGSAAAARWTSTTAR